MANPPLLVTGNQIGNTAGATSPLAILGCPADTSDSVGLHIDLHRYGADSDISDTAIRLVMSLDSSTPPTTQLWLAGNGNVGVGSFEAAPAAPLSVLGRTLADTSGDFATVASLGTLVGSGESLDLQISTHRTGTSSDLASSAVRLSGNTSSGGASNAQIWFVPLLSSGRVGIGLDMNNPQALLDVGGTARVGGDLTVDGADTKLVFTSGSNSDRQMVDFHNSSFGIGTQPSVLYFRSLSNFAFYSDGVHSGTNLDPGSGGSVRMVITSDKVGMGHFSPEGSLDVYDSSATNQQPITTNGAFTYGEERASLILTRMHGMSKTDIGGYPASLVDFRAVSSVNPPREWSVAQILGVAELNSSTNYSGGLAFLTSPGGLSDPPTSRRTHGAAPVIRMVIDANGGVGIGTTSPGGALDVRLQGPTAKWNRFVVTSTTQWDGTNPTVTIGAGGAVGIMIHCPHVTWSTANSRASIRYGRVGGVATGGFWDVGVRSNGDFSWMWNGTGNQLKLDTAGQLYANGVLLSSSAELKENISSLPAGEAIDALSELDPVKFNFRADADKHVHLGFIAESVPEIVATEDRKHISPMDVIALLTRVVKEQQRGLQALLERVCVLEAQLGSTSVG